MIYYGVMTKMNIAIILGSSDIKELLQQGLDGWDVELHYFETLKEFVNIKSKLKWFGVIIDFKQSLKTDANSRSRFLEISSRLPVLKLRIYGDNQELQGVYNIQSLRGEKIWSTFKSVCESSDGVQLRQSVRRKSIIHVKFKVSGDETTHLASTADISDHGLYIVSCLELKRDDEITVFFHNTSIETPVPSKVKWSMPWGSIASQHPGFGIKFDDIEIPAEKLFPKKHP